MFVTLARTLSASGPAVIRFDCRGMGDSDGMFVSFEAIAEDIRSAVDLAMSRMPERRIVLVGLCDGASACASYVMHDPRVSALVLMNPWVRSDVGEAKARVTHYYGGRVLQGEFWRRLFRGEVEIVASIVSLVRNLRLSIQSGPAKSQNFIDTMLNGISSFSGGIHVVLSAADLTAQEFMVLMRSSPQWRHALQRPNVTIDTLADADHTFSGSDQLERCVFSIRHFVECQ